MDNIENPALLVPHLREKPDRLDIDHSVHSQQYIHLDLKLAEGNIGLRLDFNHNHYLGLSHIGPESHIIHDVAGVDNAIGWTNPGGMRRNR